MLPHARIDNEIGCFPAAVGHRKLRFYDRLGVKFPRPTRHSRRIGDARDVSGSPRIAPVLLRRSEEPLSAILNIESMGLSLGGVGMSRLDFITLLGVTAAWPLAARA